MDLAQAAIGPGMEIYSKYSRVETISGEPVTVHDALTEINRIIAEYHQREQGEIGIDGAAQVARAMGSGSESVERLARILYDYFDRRSDSANAVAFNNVVTSWNDIINQMQQEETGRLL